MANEPSAAAIDLDAVFTAPPGLQKQMLIEILRSKIHAVQPQLANECLERFLGMDTDYLVNLALDEPSLIEVIVQTKAEIDEAEKALENHTKEKNSESKTEGEASSNESASSQGDTSFRESDVPEARPTANKPSVNDVDFELEKRIREISIDDPWTQTQYEEDPETQYDPFNGVYCVWISNFFTDATNLIYYIRGTRNVEMFCGGMAGMQAFNGPALFAITHSPLEAITQPIWPESQDVKRPKRLVKSKSPIEANKWRYVYETGRVMWGKSGIDLEKLGQAMEKSGDGDSSRSKDHHASDTESGINSEEAQTQRQCESAAGEKGYVKKVPMLRGGAARSDSVVDTQFLRRSTRKRARNHDYKSLHNGLNPWNQTEQSSTQTSKEEAAEVRPNTLQRTRSLRSPTSEPPTVNSSEVPEALLEVSFNIAAPASANKEASIPSSQEIRHPLETPASTTPFPTAPPKGGQARIRTPPGIPEKTSRFSQLDTEDDQDLPGTECGPSQTFNPPNPTSYGASAEWQSRIEQSFQVAQADVKRLRGKMDALNRGQTTVDQAQNLLRPVHAGLRYQASGRLTLLPEDTEAAEVLGSMTMNRENSGLSNVTATDAQPLETMPGILEADSDSWLSAALDRERDFEAELEE